MTTLRAGRAASDSGCRRRRPAAALPARCRAARRRGELRRGERARAGRSSCACSTNAARTRSRRYRLPAAHRRRLARLPARRRAGPGLRPARARAVRSPEHGHRFNPHKLLLDPYAREIVGRFEWRDEHFGYQPRPPRRRRAASTRATTPRCALKARVAAPLPPLAWRAPTPRPPTNWCCTSCTSRASRRLHPGVPARAARHLRRPGASGGDRAPASAGRHHAVAAAGALRARRASGWSSAAWSTTGATTRSASSAPIRAVEHAATTRPRRGDEFRAMVERAARRRPRGGARRGLQPHRRGRRDRPDAVDARAGQRAAGTGCAHDDRSRYENMHRLRQHASTSRHPRVTQFVLDCLRYWVRGDGRGRLPLRPRAGARPHRAAASIRTRRSSPRWRRTRCWRARG
ncbi:MAG: hypothetical protein MZW92_04710 [Comamonadaceae bacterium]|nr:hypothetical protein [Comamonadaceae bacterium]